MYAQAGAAVSSGVLGVEPGGAFPSHEPSILPTEAQRRWFSTDDVFSVLRHRKKLIAVMLLLIVSLACTWCCWQGDHCWRARVPMESSVPDIWETQRGGEHLQPTFHPQHVLLMQAYFAGLQLWSRGRSAHGWDSCPLGSGSYFTLSFTVFGVCNGVCRWVG